MTTVAPPPLKWAAQQIIASGVYPSAVLSGIVPDLAHLDNGGYHVSIDDLIRYDNAGDYSNRNTLDKSPPVTAAGRRYAAAFDISMSERDMIKHHGNVRRVWLNRATDTRAKYVNAINTWDGSGDAVRFNFLKGTAERASSDHKWHGHDDSPRAYVDDVRDHAAAWRSARAHVSIWTGQSHDAWLRQEQLGPYAPKPPAKPTPTPTAPPPAPVPVEDDTDMIIESRTLPPGHAYDSTGKPITGDDDAAAWDGSTCLYSLPMPPAGHKDHRWGKDYRLFVSLTGDHLTADAQVRVAINDGARWHVSTVTVPAGGDGRINVTVPPPATLTAYAITIGRMRPAGDTTDGEPDGVIGVLVEALRNA